MCVCCRFGFGRAFALLCYLCVPGWGKDQGESAPGFKGIMVVFSCFTLYIVYRYALNWWNEQRKEIRQEVRDMLNVSAELEYDYIEQVRANLAWAIQELRENLTSRIDEITLANEPEPDGQQDVSIGEIEPEVEMESSR